LKSYCSEIQESIKKFSMVDFQRLLDKKYPVNEALHEVAIYGERSMLLKICMKHGADVNHRGKDKMTPLHEVCTRGQVSLVEFLIDQPMCDLNLFDSEGNTPLMCAVRSGNAQCVLKLLNACANPFLVDAKDMSALDIAETIGGNAHIIIETLIEEAIEGWTDRFTEEEIALMMTFFGQSDEEQMENSKYVNKRTLKTLATMPKQDELLEEVPENVSGISEERFGAKSELNVASSPHHQQSYTMEPPVSDNATVMQDCNQHFNKKGPKPDQNLMSLRLNEEIEGMAGERDVTSMLSKPSERELSGSNSAIDTKRKNHMSIYGGDRNKDSINEISLETNRILERRSEARALKDSV
jgi:hypothetical protein